VLRPLWVLAQCFSHFVLWEKFVAVAEVVVAVEHFASYWQGTPSLPDFASLLVSPGSIGLVALALVKVALLVEAVVVVLVAAVATHFVVAVAKLAAVAVAMPAVIAVLVVAVAKPVVVPGMVPVDLRLG